MNKNDRRLPRWLPIVVALTFAGCSKSQLELVPVTGTVRYADGAVPEGEVRIIAFEPDGGFQGKYGPRGATAELQADGSFTAMTLKPSDGMVPGEYKIALVFYKRRHVPDLIVPDEYRDNAKTPLAPVTVKSKGKNHFDLVVRNR